MRHLKSRLAAPQRQKGVVLIVALLLLLMLTVIGVSLVRMQTIESRIAVNNQNRAIAVESAEAALRYAECSLQGGCGGALWSSSTFDQNTAGLYTLSLTAGSAVAATSPNTTASGVSWSNPGTATLPYAGPAVPSATVPQITIEKLPAIMLPGDSTRQEQYNGYGGATPYQVTAYSTGADASSHVVLQTIFRP
jgi:type IV pilus assembly protein PilX